MTSWGVVLFIVFLALGLSRKNSRSAHFVALLVTLVVLVGAGFRQHAL
jgi:hypothetical protein